MQAKEWNELFFKERMTGMPQSTRKVTEEIWRTVPNVEGYQVSDTGNVRKISLQQVIAGDEGKPVEHEDALKWKETAFPLAKERLWESTL